MSLERFPESQPRSSGIRCFRTDVGNARPCERDVKDETDVDSWRNEERAERLRAIADAGKRALA
jgi:hypothetical protein